MTLEETKILTSEQVRNLTDAQIRELPTIVDVLEHLSAIENKNLSGDPYGNQFFRMYEEGSYQPVSHPKNREIPMLMPTSQLPFTYMRGQSAYYSPCKPSLCRLTEGMSQEDKNVIAHIQLWEFYSVICNHPVIKEILHQWYVDSIALGQHYGFWTNYMDITNSKWVAAFFATTNYDSKTDVYTPKDNGIGIMYVSKQTETQKREFEEKVLSIGYQYFIRPSRQSSFGYIMQPNEDFDTDPSFERFVFRQDAVASKMVFEMSYKQQRYFPIDSLSDVARQIRKNDYELSEVCIEEAIKAYQLPITAEQAKTVLVRNGYHFHEGKNLCVSYPREKALEEWKLWNEGGRATFWNRVLPVIPFLKFGKI